MPLRLRQLVKDVKDEMVLGSPCSDSTRTRKERKEKAFFLAYSDPLLSSCDVFYITLKVILSGGFVSLFWGGLLKTNRQFALFFSIKNTSIYKCKKITFC